MMQAGKFQAMRCLVSRRLQATSFGYETSKAAKGDSQDRWLTRQPKHWRHLKISQGPKAPRPLFRVKWLQAKPNLVEHVVARCDPPSDRNRPWLDTNIKTFDASQLSVSLSLALPWFSCTYLTRWFWLFCLENTVLFDQSSWMRLGYCDEARIVRDHCASHAMALLSFIHS
jgi:hypothetical protein